MQTINLARIEYNRARGAFEGRVDICRNGTTFRYPCEIVGPETMDLDRVRAEMAFHARSMSDTPAYH